MTSAGLDFIREVAEKMRQASAWEWKGDPTRRDGWTVVGEDKPNGHPNVLVSYDSISGVSSRPLREDGMPGEWLMPREKAEELHDRICLMDEAFWPPFNPVVVEVEDLDIVEYHYPPEAP